MRGLYIHVPFCLSKCPYCDFYSVKYSKSLIPEYAESVKRNILSYNETYDTVYFGGGTPILISEYIAEFLKLVRCTDEAEITAEANPCVSDSKRLSELYNGGVNRISFGVQSMKENELKFLGRRHTPEQSVSAIKEAYKAGFKNISADLMLGLENQDKNSVSDTVNKLSELPVTHISAYLLKVEEKTPFYNMKLTLPDEDYVSELYLYTVELLEKNGFKQYEISNFAKEGYESRHNLHYWRCEEYIGIGPAAHSYYKGKRFSTARSLDDFIGNEIQKVTVTDEFPGQFDEYAMLKLRLSEGLRYSECESFGVDISKIKARCRLIPKEYIYSDDMGISLTPKGFLVSNAIIGKLLGY